METRDSARLVVNVMVYQRDLSRFGVITEQLQINIRQPGGRATPYRPPKVGPEGSHALHPDQGQLAQGVQFAGLGVGAKERDVFAHRVFHRVIVGHRGARRQPKLTQGAALGRAPFQPLFDDQSGGGAGDFGAQWCWHGRTGWR